MLEKHIVVTTNNFYPEVEILMKEIPKLLKYLAELPPMSFKFG